MAVKAETLDTPERDMTVQTRDGKAVRKPGESLSEADALRRLQQKIRVGLNSEASVDPRDGNPPACRACYQRGWAAALKSLLED